MTSILVKLAVKNSDNVGDPAVREKYGVLSGTVGIVCNLVLFAFKLLAGLLTGAVSIMADAFNNLSDAASSVVTLIGFKLAGKPADTDHPFGHGRIEYLCGLFVSMAILLMGYELLSSSIDKILHPQPLEFKLLPAIILAASIVVKLWLARFNFTLSKKIGSEAMRATATDSLSDCISTGAVLGGLLIFKFFNLNLDAYIGLAVAILVMVAGYRAAKDTIQPLLGSAPDPEVVKQIREIVLSEPLILEIHDMIIHDYGPGRRMVTLHAEIAYDVDILEAHDVIDNMEQRLTKELQYEATIHMDPVITDDEELKEARQMVERLIHQRNEAWKLHDFRMVRGNTHTNLIFDLVVGTEDMKKEKEIEAEIKDLIHSADKKYYAVLKVEQSYV